jgi:hypothetical protein
VNGPGSLAAETLQNVCKNGAEIFIENTDELVVRAGGIQEWTEDVKNGSLPAFGEKFSHWHDCLERWMIERGKEKAGSNLFDTVAKFVGWQIDANAESFESVRSSALRGNTSVAVFYDSDTGCCKEKNARGGDIKEI